MYRRPRRAASRGRSRPLRGAGRRARKLTTAFAAARRQPTVPALRKGPRPGAPAPAPSSPVTPPLTLPTPAGDFPLPLPGPKPPIDPFDRSTWGAAMARLALQAVAYGLLAVAVDAAPPAPLAAAARIADRLWRRRGSGGGTLGAPAVHNGDSGGEGWRGEDEEVVRERREVEARVGCHPDECSVRP